MSGRDAVAILLQAERIAEIREEMEAEAEEFWNRNAPADRSEWAYQQSLLERMQWEADQEAIREYDSWFLQKTIAEQDAEGIAER